VYKTNRLNHNFQIANFIAGSCHTPDGMYAILCDQRDGRVAAIANYERNLLKEKAERIRAERLCSSSDEADQLDGQAKLAELDFSAETGQILYQAAKDELSFINYCIEQLQPFRKYSDMSDSEAAEKAQAEEWKLELMTRAENHLICTGFIPVDQFDVMRKHPSFKSEILPHINKIKRMLFNKEPIDAILTQHFQLPTLGNSNQLPPQILMEPNEQ
jgi:hypothetical protein